MKSSVKVLHIISSLDQTVGGPARSLPTSCLETQKLGIDNHILTYCSPHPNIDGLEEAGVTVSFVENENNIVSRILSLNFRSALDHIDCDIIHLHSLWSLPLHWAASHGRKNKIPLVISPRGTLERMDKVKKSQKKRIAWQLYQKKDLQLAAYLHATAAQEKDNLCKLGLGVPVEVIPNILNIHNYPLKDYSDKSKSTRTILFLSRIHPKKGIEILMESWSQIPPPEREGWQILLVGDGDAEYIGFIESLIQKKYRGCNIRYTGARYGKEKIEEYHNADVFILPTHSENFGMVIAEAMACGLPVITTKGAPWSIISENNAGWWVENSVGEIRRSLTEAISLTDSQREEKGRKCREIIKVHFSPESIARAYRDLYARICNSSDFNRISK